MSWARVRCLATDVYCESAITVSDHPQMPSTAPADRGTRRKEIPPMNNRYPRTLLTRIIRAAVQA